MDIVNPAAIAQLTQTDPVMLKILDTHGTPPAWSREPGFVSLAKIILEQQVSLASAMAHFRKLETFMGEFTVVNILKLSDEEFRNCHISRQKTLYLRGLAEAIAENRIVLEELANKEEPEVREILTSLKGIGTWTSDIYLMFCLRSKDIFPIGDIAVVNTIKELYNIHDKEEMVEFSKRWSPNRSLAVHFLWHHYLKSRNREFPF